MFILDAFLFIESLHLQGPCSSPQARVQGGVPAGGQGQVRDGDQEGVPGRGRRRLRQCPGAQLPDLPAAAPPGLLLIHHQKESKKHSKKGT